MNASVPLVGEAGGERGFVIAERISGERALPVAGRLVLLSEERLCRHLLVCGATGAGKTETLMRLAWTVAKISDAPVFYLDGKGDRENAQRFAGLMAGAGRASAVIPGAVRHFGGMRILEMGGVRAAPDKVDLDLRQQPQEALRDVGR